MQDLLSTKVSPALLLVIAVVLVFIYRADISAMISVLSTSPLPQQNLALIKLGSTTLPVEFATSVAEKARGLSGRDSLPEDQGMLFFFQNPSKYSFWMYQMKFPLDMIWISGDRKVVDISENVPAPKSSLAPPAIVTPSAPVKYVLEVNAGWARKHYISIGDELVFENPSTPQ